MAAATGSLVTVQATIYAMEAGEGSALLDDGLEVEVPAEALIGSGLRFLRPGQRVSIELDESGTRATRVLIVGIGNGEVAPTVRFDPRAHGVSTTGRAWTRPVPSAPQRP